MKPLLVAPVAALVFACAAPAGASAGLFCEPVDKKSSGPSLGLVITRGLPGGIFGATLGDGKTSRSTMGDDAPLALVQAWIDERRIMVDLADREVTEYVAKLRVKPARGGEGASGTLKYGGRRYAVRCEGE